MHDTDSTQCRDLWDGKYRKFQYLLMCLSLSLSVDDSGKIIIFPGYMDGELAKKSDSRVSILKSGGTAKSKSSEDKDKEALKKEISFTGSGESLVHKTEKERKAKDTDLDTGKIDMEAKVKGSDLGMPTREEAQVKASEARIPQGPASQEKENEVEIPQGQAASQEKENEVEIPQGPASQVKESEAKTPKGSKVKVKKSKAGTLQGQKPPENTESSAAKGNQAKEKEDAGKTTDMKETDAKDKKSGEGKDQVKGKKEPQVKRKKAEAKKETGN
ncbi:uncharacterized protein C6orf10 homolog [Myotis lucifugus]|uniref:uncharacterized protein C6orf10 homolog n=1 Tax=Myotis lucifugus TaxID=59463 RepID=UPI0006D70F8E|nr:uncharacterized protein C6orf10 homolog [Myotis lucifugus]